MVHGKLLGKHGSNHERLIMINQWTAAANT